MKPFEFDQKTAIEVILYIANRLKKRGFHRISKIIYFADKAHLEKYGRFICGDNYIAMKDGPVPSGIYDILKTVRGDGCFDLKQEPDFEVRGEYIVVPHRDADVGNFSISDLECLDEAIAQYGTLSFSELRRLSHLGAWDRADRNIRIDIEHIVADFENPDEILEFLRDPYPG